ncbi:MAG: ABC transporter substrate-binding protein [Deltaproteobacteria bacterium]|nr:ABC transporter substrate-binding protein [Deltaproteobacteria bacterium]
MRRIAILLFSFILIHAPTHDALSAEKPGKLTPLRIAVASRSATVMPLFVARERGFFRAEGFEAEIIVMKAAQTVQALVGGSVDFGTATGTAVSAAVNGVEVQVVLAVVDRPTFDLIAQPSFTSVEQLRGKKIGVSAFGSLTEILARRILLAHGVRPDQATLLALGPSQVTYMALKTKLIDATVLQIPLNFGAIDEGFRKLAYAGDSFRSVQGGLVTTKAIISQKPDMVTRAVRAILRAIRLIRNDRKFGIEFIKGPHLDIEGDRNRFGERVYDAMRPLYLESGAVDEELQREMITDAAQRIKPAQPVPPEWVFDFSFARKVGETLR